MDNELTLIREFFKGDRFAMAAGAEIISASRRMAECHMTLGDIHLNAANSVQGGAIFTLADFTFAVHSNYRKALGEDVGVTVAQSCSISFLKSPKGEKLIAKSALLSEGRRVSVYRITVEDELGNPIAEMHGNGFRKG
ncbi:MAG: PaaI family thioesterase [Clostridiales Family XIII bacterium]|jgi:acyl-CoA thioesterase|nr:PaaI family thioesterase [Clostridiales Family XIII bacterium]